MEIFGFICLTVILVLFTCGWMFMLIFDGAFGKREIPVYVMVVIICAVIYGWVLLVQLSPFTVTVN